MRRHLEDHSGLNNNRIFSNTSVPPTSVTSSSAPTRTVVNDTRLTRTVDVESRLGSVAPSIPVTTAGPGTSSSSTANLTLHHSSRTVTTPLSPGPATTGIAKPSVQRQPLALIQETVHSVGSVASGEMQTSVQFSMSSGYQSRVAQAATTLSQASHGLSQSPSALHHPHPTQLQSHPAQVMHPGQVNSQANVTQMPGHQMQFQRLKVEDALSYLDQVKYRFGNQPQVYNDFLDIMKEFKSQSIDTPGVIQRVSTLFKGHPELIVGFNTFLPPGYRIEVQSNEQVQVSIPGTNIGSGGTGPTSLTINPGGTITTQPLHSSHGNQPNHMSHSNSPHHTSGNAGSKALNHQPPVANSQVHIKSEPSQNQHSFNQSSPAHTHSSGASPGVHSPNSAPQTNQPVEFNHAINYVNKIKNRFQGQPDIYKQFLEILHTYQKEQRNLKDGVHTSTKPLTEAEVYAQVAKLFQNQEDLLQEFGQFLPDANGANALVSLQPPKTMNNDHPLPVKKPVLQGKSTPPPTSAPAKQVPAIKRPTPSAPSPPAKKPKMTSLKDVSLSEAGKYGTLNEFAFFDKVRKALKSQEAYENFLRLLVLYNQEIISRADLVQMVAPFLSKYPELFKWFKDFLGYKESANNVDAVPNKVTTMQERERVVGDFATEIDYSSCRKYGASYRAVPKNYVQPKCSGRTTLCKDVLNDTWVSFPSWSEDSTFVSSRKTQYEEYIYRCEDERFELDILLDSTLSTIQTLQAVQEKINRMSAEEKVKFRLDDNLGGSSTVIHQRNVKRIYGDKAPDVIEGLKKNPVTAVPLVLKRLKVKEEEWRKAQKTFNKIWKEQNEKYYLKSLDHQGITFKQNDVKFLRSKSLATEIENISEERHEQAEDCDVPVEPHISAVYKNKDILKDAANLIIHHVKRQTGMHKEDKHKIKQLMRQFIPDLFAVPRGEMSDDEIDNDEMMEIYDENENSKTGYNDAPPLKPNSSNHLGIAESSNIQDVSSGHDNVGPEIQLSENPGTSAMENCLPGDSYALFYVNNNWYIFFRLHNILCERLCKIYDRAQVLLAEEIKDREERKQSTAIALRLKPKSNIAAEAYYTTFLDMIKSLLDQNIDANQYEDTLREMFGIEAYWAFTLEKVVQNVVRQLQHIVADEACTSCTALFVEEHKNKATGGFCATALSRSAFESAYQKKAERLHSDESYYYKIIIYKNEGKLTIELLDSESDQSEGHCEGEKWNNYFGIHSVPDDSLSSEVKERLSKSPVFLLRNVRIRRQLVRNADDKGDVKVNQDNNYSPSYMAESELDSKIDLSRLEDSTASDAVKGLVGLNSKALLMEKTRSKSSEDRGRAECKFNVNSYRMLFVVHSESVLYNQLALCRARELHKKVSHKLDKHFHGWHKKWLRENVSDEETKKCQNWLLGRKEDSKPTLCVKVDNQNKPPYACFNRYRVEDKT